MSAIDRLVENCARQIALPWATHVAGSQRVWFAVYPPAEERRIRARLPQFETLTLQAEHEWLQVDLTRLFPEYLASHRYRDAIFQRPQHLRAGAELEALAVSRIKEKCVDPGADAGTVIAVTGLASLFDFVRVSSLVAQVEDSVPGRLLIFFPGDYSGSVYRFMDARDGFNYMAVSITTAESFLIP